MQKHPFGSCTHGMHHIWHLHFSLYNGIMYYPLLWSTMDKSACGATVGLSEE